MGLCRGFGRPLALRLLGPRDLEQGERLFARTGGWLVVLSRWLPIFPEVIACMAGLARMPLWTFLIALLCGSAPLGFAFAAIGHAGRRASRARDRAERARTTPSLARRAAPRPGEGARARRASQRRLTVMAKKPTPKPFAPAELKALANAVIAADRFPHLATVDQGRPRVRPVSPVRTDGFTVYVANLRSYGKTAEIAANPAVELCYLSAEHDQVRISGRAEVVTERALLEQIWADNPLLRHYLGSIDNPELLVYRVVPERVRFMREWALDYHEVPLDSSLA